MALWYGEDEEMLPISHIQKKNCIGLQWLGSEYYGYTINYKRGVADAAVQDIDPCSRLNIKNVLNLLWESNEKSLRLANRDLQDIFVNVVIIVKVCISFLLCTFIPKRSECNS